MLSGGTVILNALDPKIVDGFAIGDSAVVCDAGHMSDAVRENVNLSVYDGASNIRAIEEEKNYVVLHTAFAVEQLGKARESHLAAEKYFVEAMDFDNNNRLYSLILRDVFGDAPAR